MRKYTFPIGLEPVPVYVPETENDLREFTEWFRSANERGSIAFDTETTGLDIFSPHYRLRTAQFGDRDCGWVLRTEVGKPFLDAATRALREAESLTIHNAPFDWLVSDQHIPGVSLEMLAPKTIDTRIQAMLIDPRQVMEGGIGTGLKPLSDHYISPDCADTQGDLKDEFRAIGATKETGWARIDVNNKTYLTYAGGDVILGSRLQAIQAKILRRMGVRKELEEYERELARVCAVMQRRGIVVDQEYVDKLDCQLEKDYDKFAAIARRYGVTSVNSSDQVVKALTGTGVKLTEKTDSGALSVGKSVLTKLSGLTLQGEEIEGAERNELAYSVYRAKRAGKWRSAYVGTFRETVDAHGRIHPHINSLQARTARMSITRPALQTLPSSDWMIRRAFCAEPGELWFSVDFKAVEMRVLAALADVKRMKEAIAAGLDLHDLTTELVYGKNFTSKQRKICKGVGFGKVFGGGVESISHLTGAPAEDVSYALAAYDRIYPEVKRTSRRWQREARARGFVTVTVTGRHLPLDVKRAYAVVNYQVQSAARDVLGQSLLNMDEAGLLPYLRLPIHDEVVGSAPARDAQEIVKEISRCMTMELGGVPIESDPEIGGLTWGSLYGASV